MHSSWNSPLSGSIREQECQLAISHKTHLGKEVEIIFTDHHETRLMPVERLSEAVRD
jgi:hypothetical protein